MIRNTGTDRQTARTVAKVAIAGMVVGAPLAFLASPASAAGNNWDAVAQCESGGNWSTNTGNGFSGGLQFTPSTWAAYGGSGSPQGASKGEQIQVAERVLAGQGAGAWPVCGKSLGAASPSAVTKSAPKASNTSSTTSTTSNSAPKAAAPKAAAPQAAAPEATTKSAPKASSSAPKSSAAPKATASSAPKGGADYVVKSGDTLSTIAQNQGIEGGYQALFSLNRDSVQDVNLIYVGQHLNLR